ncbi:hypothetical protein Hamer_G022743 [Homarus americanus]|uniref:Uncharacterized protein n=1 Tax=Homarus americanus TaxID=6706 RepID=A0A8J5N697_HOMAM|nr:hypothetical protein Hamer_G022743 [Homarus americanus]
MSRASDHFSVVNGQESEDLFADYDEEAGCNEAQQNSKSETDYDDNEPENDSDESETMINTHCRYEGEVLPGSIINAFKSDVEVNDFIDKIENKIVPYMIDLDDAV